MNLLKSAQLEPFYSIRESLFQITKKKPNEDIFKIISGVK